MDITGLSIISFQLKQGKLQLSLVDMEQAISDGMYIKTCLRVIKKTNYINKAVLAWRRRTLVDCTIALFWPFITEAHKKQQLKLEQGNNKQARSVMLQKTVKDMALKINHLERYTNQQQHTMRLRGTVTFRVINRHLVDPAEAATELVLPVEVMVTTSDDRQESLEPSKRMLTDDSRDMKMPTGQKRNSRTRITATLMVMNDPMDMIVHIAPGLRKDTVCLP